MIAPESIFSYVGTVPRFGDPPWTVEMQEAVEDLPETAREGAQTFGDVEADDPGLDALLQSRVHQPPSARAQLVVEEAGLTPNAGWHRGVWRPKVLRLRFSLTSERAEHGACFHVDRGIARAFSPGDRLYVSNTGSGGIALSVLRSDRLVLALGAVMSVPLGRDVSVRLPVDALARAEAVLRQADPTFGLKPFLLEVTMDGQRRLCPGTGRGFPDWSVTVLSVPEFGLPGTDECVAMLRRGACDPSAAEFSAQLMADDMSQE
jgi:hypothetical protein